MSQGNVSAVRVAVLGVALVGLGALGFHEIPGLISPDAEGTKLVNAVYCAIITLTTVGFGDICPSEISWLGRTFIVFLSFSGLGMFCGPIMDLAASWKDKLPVGGTLTLLCFIVATSVFLFSYLLEEMTEAEAVYFSIITGTTIGYGDISPKSDAAKIAVALYAILAVNVVGTVLEPTKDFLLGFCTLPVTGIDEDEDEDSIETTDNNANQSTKYNDNQSEEDQASKSKNRRRKNRGKKNR